MKLCKNMNIIEAAEFLGVSERTLRTYASNGRITPAYVRGKTRSVADFAIEDLETLKAELGNPAINGRVITVEKPENPAAHKNTANTENRKNTATMQTLVKPEIRQLPVSANQGNIDGAQLLTNAFKTASESWPTNLAAKMLLTIPEAMTLSGIKEKPLRDAIKTGALRSIRIGRSIQVRPADLQKWVDSQFSD
jgi:predicted DNA-binding transcriptional regulator AlpA